MRLTLAATIISALLFAMLTGCGVPAPVEWHVVNNTAMKKVKDDVGVANVAFLSLETKVDHLYESLKKRLKMAEEEASIARTQLSEQRNKIAELQGKVEALLQIAKEK